VKEQWLKKTGDQVNVLNRKITMTSRGIETEADPRHVNLIVEEMGATKPITSTLPRDDGEGGEVVDKEEVDKADLDIYENGVKVEEELKLNNKDKVKTKDEIDDSVKARKYRANAARLNYLSQDRIDLRHASKVIARGMAKPTEQDWARLKHVARYLMGRPRMKTVYGWGQADSTAKVFSDSDWAGDRRDRRSTSGGVIMIGGHCIKHWSKIQGVTAQSSGEAELYAAVRAASDAIGIKSQAEDLGMKIDIELNVDAKAAIGMMNREGLGTTRHVEVKWFWIQEAVRQNRISLKKVSTLKNPADLGTKILDPGVSRAFCELVGSEFVR